MSSATIRLFYDMWPQCDRRLRDVVAGLSDEQLATRPSAERWPVWASVGHMAGMRVYWLCHVAGEPGAEATPFQRTDGIGWEDEPERPRSADELVAALESSFAVVEGCLDRWTPEMLSEEIERQYLGRRQLHTRGSIVQRVFSHDAYHSGQLSQTLGIAGLRPIDLWTRA